MPHVTIPEPSIMKAILEAVQLYPAEIVVQYIPKFWSHMIMFGHLDMIYLLESILHLMSVHCKPVSDSSLIAQFAEIALTIWDHIQVIETLILLIIQAILYKIHINEIDKFNTNFSLTRNQYINIKNITSIIVLS